jgi:hypothetical protein
MQYFVVKTKTKIVNFFSFGWKSQLWECQLTKKVDNLKGHLNINIGPQESNLVFAVRY